MAGLSQSSQQVALDAVFPTSAGTDYIAYSANGTSETTSLARTAIGATGWAAATAATPSVKANNAALTSAAATASVTVSHYAIFSASTAGTQKIDWQAIEDPNSPGTPLPRSLVAGDSLTWGIGKVKVSLD